MVGSSPLCERSALVKMRVGLEGPGRQKMHQRCKTRVLGPGAAQNTRSGAFFDKQASHARVIRPSQGSGRRKSPKTRVLEAPGVRFHGEGRRLGTRRNGIFRQKCLPRSSNSTISKSGISGVPLKTLSDWISVNPWIIRLLSVAPKVECCSEIR